MISKHLLSRFLAVTKNAEVHQIQRRAFMNHYDHWFKIDEERNARAKRKAKEEHSKRSTYEQIKLLYEYAANETNLYFKELKDRFKPTKKILLEHGDYEHLFKFNSQEVIDRWQKENQSKMVETVPTQKVIGTHNGSFHCDEILACFMLKQLPEYVDARIVRTRDLKELEKCDIVVDVGAEFDPSRKRFDHHQRSFTETFSSLIKSYENGKIKLSSAGLIYVFYGKQVLKEIIKKDSRNQNHNYDQDEKFIETLYYKIYEQFIKEIDAIDNGINIADERRYEITTNLSARVSHFNPDWNDTDKDETTQFMLAMKLVGSELTDKINYYTFSWWSARSIIENSIKNRFNIDPSGSIIFIDSYAPWKSHLFQLERELKLSDNELKYVIYGDKDATWRIQCIPVNEGSFTNRLSLPSEWWGIREEELSKLANIPDCIFVHANGFIGGNKTYEGALQMLTKSLELNATNAAKKIKI